MKKSSKRQSIAASGAWVPVPLHLLQSKVFAELSPHGVKLLFDALALLGPNARGNGDLSLSPKTMHVRGWNGRETLNAAARELIAAKLLIKTRQGSRLDCSLFALSFFPLDCDLSKLDVRPGCYSTRDWQHDAERASPPTLEKPAEWNRCRKNANGSPATGRTFEDCPATGQSQSDETEKAGTLSRHGTKPPVLGGATVPPRVTFIDLPSTGGFAGGVA